MGLSKNMGDEHFDSLILLFSAESTAGSKSNSTEEGLLHVKSYIVVPLVWCTSSERRCQLRCGHRQLIAVQNDGVSLKINLALLRKRDVNITKLHQKAL
ncbi:hypothetical protein AVEN_127673-1 [Araneus ventricosus]|uniref:Uncharacterized protein n=1 Tax=Araneus ventricosus TaxID=182803 RepID=A0A4Y2Q192_ARAVE|nr:hypothetical protein AVEN_127673-1 [Araneus ventricosus]